MSREPLLLLSGLGSTEDAWRDQVRDLGATPVMPRGATIAEMAATVLAEAPPRSALAGHSMGGYVALAAALAAPERISRLALVNTSAAADMPGQRENRLRLIAAIEARGLAGVLPTMAQALSADPAIQRRVTAQLAATGGERIGGQHRACMARPDRRGELGRLALPVLVIGADDDAVVPPTGSHDLAAGIAGARLIMFPAGGHMSPMAHPEAVTALLREWREGAGGG